MEFFLAPLSLVFTFIIIIICFVGLRRVICDVWTSCRSTNNPTGSLSKNGRVNTLDALYLNIDSAEIKTARPNEIREESLKINEDCYNSNSPMDKRNHRL